MTTFTQHLLTRQEWPVKLMRVDHPEDVVTTPAVDATVVLWWTPILTPAPVAALIMCHHLAQASGVLNLARLETWLGREGDAGGALTSLARHRLLVTGEDVLYLPTPLWRPARAATMNITNLVEQLSSTPTPGEPHDH